MRQALAVLVVGSNLVLSGPTLAQERAACKELDSLINAHLLEQIVTPQNRFEQALFSLHNNVNQQDIKQQAGLCLPQEYPTPLGTYRVTISTIVPKEFYVEGDTWYYAVKVE